MSCQEAFIQRLRDQGFRLTPQRETILSTLHEIDKLTTAEEIHSRVRNHTPSIDISTIYRTLELLQKFGLVACIEYGSDQRQYELLAAHAPHIHLVCRVCGEIISADIDIAQSLVDVLERGYSFQVDLEQLSIPGLCEACAARQNLYEDAP